MSKATESTLQRLAREAQRWYHAAEVPLRQKISESNPGLIEEINKIDPRTDAIEGVEKDAPFPVE